MRPDSSRSDLEAPTRTYVHHPPKSSPRRDSGSSDPDGHGVPLFIWFPIPRTTLVDEIVAMVAGAGWAGIELFFVLSGFLITRILINSKDEQRHFRTFYARRVLRIFPLHYGLLRLILVGEQLVRAPAFQVWVSLVGPDLCYRLFVPNLLNATRADFGPVSMDVSWSLAMEEQFYFVWPVLVLVLERRRLLGVCVARWSLHRSGEQS